MPSSWSSRRLKKKTTVTGPTHSNPFLLTDFPRRSQCDAGKEPERDNVKTQGPGGKKVGRPKESIHPAAAVESTESGELESASTCELDVQICKLCSRTLKEPKLLACLHSFCEECLKKRVSKGLICCSECQAATVVPRPGGVSALPSNFIAANSQAVHRLRDGQGEIVCDPCGGDSDADEATHRCAECGVFLCEIHVLSHKKTKKTAQHALTPVAELRQQEGRPLAADFAVVRRTPLCSVRGHEDKPLELFCSKCDSLVCRDCIVVKHRDHDYSFVRDCAEDQRAQLEASLLSVRKSAGGVAKVHGKVKKTQSALTKCVEELSEKITETADLHRKRIEHREKALQEQLGKLCSPKALLLEQQYSARRKPSPLRAVR